jgi:hypothetical protein
MNDAEDNGDQAETTDQFWKMIQETSSESVEKA